MKRLIIILIFLQFSNIGFSQDYIPMAESDKIWIYDHIKNEDTGGIDGTFMLATGKDTTFNSLKYKIIDLYNFVGYNPSTENSKAFKLKIFGYIRDDSISKKVFFLQESENAFFSCDIDEYILFDFGLNVGDSISTKCYDLSGGYEWPIHTGIVDSTGFEDNRFTLYTAGKLMAGLSGAGVKRISEGIGFHSYGLFHDLLFPLHRFCEGTLEECNIEVVTSSKDLYDNQFLKIYPNPATDRIEIKSSEKINNFILYDLSGKKMSSGKYYNSIDLSSLNAGLYYLKLFLNDGIVTKRVVKVNQK